MNPIGCYPAPILLPTQTDMTKWSVVACDQYTSEPDYWKQVERLVGDAPSTLRLTLPEIYLEQPDVADRIAKINTTMDAYLQQNLLTTLEPGYLYVRRTLADGPVRQGVIAMLDLEQYDYRPGAQSLIRASEGTVIERIPPRVRVREHAALELPHIMVLIDDPAQTVIEPCAAQCGDLRPVYDFQLMQHSGRLTGYHLNAAQSARIDAALSALADPAAFAAKYHTAQSPLLFAVGDGNHSLATAKTCFEQLKKTMPQTEWETHPARYALVEIVNIHDASLAFEPIHRVIFDCAPQQLRAALSDYYTVSETPLPQAQSFRFLSGGCEQTLWIADPSSNLPVGTLQNFLDAYLADHAGRIDYIHGDDTLRALAQKPDTVGFLLPPMQKSDFFSTIIIDGVLPRKTFSMGHACDKRFYLECRKITR